MVDAKIAKKHKVEKKGIVLLGIGIVVLFLIVKLVGASRIVPVLLGMDYRYLGLIVGFQALVILTWNLRWNFIVNKLKRSSFFRLMPIFMSGLLVNNLTPGPSIGGEPVTAYYLSKETKKSFSECLATVVMDMAVHTIGFLVFAAFAILYVFLFIQVRMIQVLLGILILVISVLAIISYVLIKKSKSKGVSSKFESLLKWIYKIRFLEKIMKRFKKYEELRKHMLEQIKRFKETVTELMKFKRLLIGTFVLALMLHVFEFLKVYTAFLSLGQSVPIVYIIVVTSIASTLGYFIFLPGGTGVVEAAMIAMYFELGIPLGVAATATLISRAVFYLSTYGVGYASLSYLNLKYK